MDDEIILWDDFSIVMKDLGIGGIKTETVKFSDKAKEETKVLKPEDMVHLII